MKAVLSLLLALTVVSPILADEAEPQAVKKITYLGVSTTPVDPALASQLKLSPGFGLLVRAVADGSPAEEAGVKPYDVLKKLDDQLLVNVPQLTVLVRAHKPDEIIKLTVARQAKDVVLPVTLGQKEAPERPGPVERFRRWIPRRIPYEHIPRPEWRMPPMPDLPPLPEMPKDVEEKVREFIKRHCRHSSEKPACRPKPKGSCCPKAGSDEKEKDQVKPDGVRAAPVPGFTIKMPKYTVIVHDTNGEQKATIMDSAGKVLHKDVPADEWESLPEDVRKLIKGIRIETDAGSEPVMKLRI